MYLKSLTLKGFKSFAQPTTFSFEPGVTCVVGPNGSGKSNVVDALAWVMGEQGVKTLRGGTMDDVIFAGTSTRGPLGRAEVTLTIDNSDGALPIEYGEVAIRRTLFRSGTSEYAINGHACRLLDIQDLLSDSGLGREMHVIVGQGQLDTVLHASSEERRGFIEEAAGIVKHRKRKEKTVRKLDAMHANLARLSDLSAEVRRQLTPLGRQAEAAKEAQTIAAIVRDARARLLADEIVTARRALDAHTLAENAQRTEAGELEDQIERARTTIARLEEAHSTDAVDEARRSSLRLENAHERFRSLFTLVNQSVAFLGNQADAQPSGSTATRENLDEANREFARTRELCDEGEREWRAAQNARDEARNRLNAIDTEIANQTTLASRYDHDIAALSARLEGATHRLTALREEAERDASGVAAARERSEAAHMAAQSYSAPYDVDVVGARASDAYQLADAHARHAEAEVESARDRVHASERERDALGAKVNALARLIDESGGSSTMLDARLAGVTGVVADTTRVKTGYETAIAVALGPLADAILATSHENASAAIDHAARHKLGAVDIVVASAVAVKSRDEPHFPSLVRATSLVTAPDGVLSLLSSTHVADDIATARTAWAAMSESDRATATLITKSGDVISRVVVRSGSRAKPNRLELAGERDDALTRHNDSCARIEQETIALAEKRGLLEVAREQLRAAVTEVREGDARRAAHVEAMRRRANRCDEAVADYERLDATLSATRARVVEAEAAVTSAQHERDAAQSIPRPNLAAHPRAAPLAEFEAAREREVEVRLRLEAAQERHRTESARVASLEKQCDRERAAATRAARVHAIRRRHIAAATAVAQSLPAVLASVDRSVTHARLEVSRVEAERSNQERELSAVRHDEGELRERHRVITASVHARELRCYEKKLVLTGLLERVRSDLGLDEKVLIDEYGPHTLVAPDHADEADHENDAPGVPFERARQQERLERAEATLAHLGRVNPLAFEEFEALEQRHAFLTEQLADLSSTRRDLLTLIDDIDDKMQAIFVSAFDDTKEEFARVFPILFPGGTGSIHLTDPSDLGATGIEVVAKPAGKRIERLSLLSGGERSLAAVALLIAIFKARPSPFYVMDEVEATLDDANLGRLLAIFENLRESSQLIVITHQKRTMEIADALYGVSMRADGVSAVVGQRVDVPARAVAAG